MGFSLQGTHMQVTVIGECLECEDLQLLLCVGLMRLIRALINIEHARSHFSVGICQV